MRSLRPAPAQPSSSHVLIVTFHSIQVKECELSYSNSVFLPNLVSCSFSSYHDVTWIMKHTHQHLLLDGNLD